MIDSSEINAENLAASQKSTVSNFKDSIIEVRKEIIQLSNPILQYFVSLIWLKKSARQLSFFKHKSKEECMGL